MYTYFSAAKLADYSYTPFLTMELLDREYKLDLSCINRLHDADRIALCQGIDHRQRVVGVVILVTDGTAPGVDNAVIPRTVGVAIHTLKARAGLSGSRKPFSLFAPAPNHPLSPRSNV